jgi:hypothetical protein
MITVFVSSVSVGLEDRRTQIISDLQTAGYDVGAMERFGAQPQIPIDVCLREVRKADVVVLLVGPRYGSLLPQGISYTHAEFREAQGAGTAILAFRIPDDPSLPNEESGHLAAFVTEVGGASTFDRLLPTESLERLSARVLAALSSARDRGELAHRFSVFQKYERFFAAQLGDTSALFNHEGPFIGREQQLERLTEFINGTEPVLLLKAPGGSGKSRLLLEAAKAAAQRPDAPHVLFVDSAASWSAEDINLLPSAPTVLVFDDAHRRPDLDRIIAACQQHSEDIRCLVSCRPSAVGIVRPLVAQLLPNAEPAEIDLPPLTKKHAEALAQHVLGSQLQYLAERLVNIADRNPLVIGVGARCIAERRVPPEMLERTPEVFRRVVLDRLLDDPALTSSDATARRQILEVISAIGPVATEDDELRAQLAAMVTKPDHEVRRLLATLERTQFLMRRGRLVRVSPDVLADHLLYRAAVDETGRSTGFVDTMVTSFPPSLENILANAAELDWRSTAIAGHESVLTTVWRDMFQLLPTMSNRQRSELVDQLKRAAIFAPAEVLSVCEWLIQHPDAPNDELLVKWGLDDSPEKLNETLTDVVALIATHPDFTKRCAAQLWTLAAVDDQPQNSYPSHSRRRLADLVKYERRSDWEANDGVHAKTIECLIERLRNPSRRETAVWAISALANALSRTGEENEWNRRVFTLREFSLASFVPRLYDRRSTVIQCLVDIALSARLDEAATALTELSALLKAPRGPFGHGLESSEVAVWQPESEKAISLIQMIAESAASEVIRFLARRELRSAPQEHWPQIAPALKKALKESKPVPGEKVYDLLIGVPWQEQLHEYAAEEDRINALCAVAAQAFWEEHSTPSSVVKALLAAMSAFHGIGRETDSQTGRLVRALVLANTNDPSAFVRQLMSEKAGWPLLRSALLAIHEKQPGLAEALVAELSLSEHDVIRASALDAAEWMVDRAVDLPTLLELTRKLSQDRALVVRGASSRVLRRLAKQSQSDALEILTSIDWDGDLWLGDTVLGALDVRYGLDPGQLSDVSVDTLLARIEQLRTFEGRNYEVLQFISFASERRPRQTIEMLIRRIRATDEHAVKKGSERWLPMPYSGRGLSLPGVHRAANRQELVSLIRDASTEASSSVQFWLPALFHLADPDLEVGRAALREWATSGQPQKIIGAARLLKGFDHSIVFSEHELISELLIAANRVGVECLQDTRSELFSLAISGVYSGAPGEPAPRHLHDKAEAQRLAEAYAATEPVRDFYRSLLGHAESSIRFDVALWDEGDDE